MGDASSVDFDMLRGGSRPRALVDTVGMKAPQRAAFWLERLAAAHHRGPRRDTWTSARDRAARAAGVEISMAKRIWQRWETMRDVSGEVTVKLMIAYEAMCERNEAAAEAYRAERLRLEGVDAAAKQEPSRSGDRVAQTEDRSSEAAF